MLGRYIYFWLQKFYWPVLRATLFRLYRVRVADPYHIIDGVPSSTIIVSNHQTPLDPFIISILFPHHSPIYPIRFMANFKKFEDPKLEYLRKTGIIFVIYFLFGAFSSRRGQGIERALKAPIYFLQKKESVLIFPEGRMAHDRTKIGEIKRGAAVLAKKTHRPILPVALMYRRKEYTVHVGKLFTIESGSGEPEAIALIQTTLQTLFQSIQQIS